MTMSDTSNDGPAQEAVDDSSSTQTDTSSNGSSESISDGGDDGIRRNAVERGLFMLLFGVIGYFAFWAIALLAIVQLVFVLVNKDPNGEIQRFSRNLAEYISQIARFLSFATEEKPCPFSPFPNVDAGE